MILMSVKIICCRHCVQLLSENGTPKKPVCLPRNRVDVYHSHNTQHYIFAKVSGLGKEFTIGTYEVIIYTVRIQTQYSYDAPNDAPERD